MVPFTGHWVFDELDKRLTLKTDESKDNDRANQVRSYRSKLFNPMFPYLQVMQRGE
jgi:hypothetical protein